MKTKRRIAVLLALITVLSLIPAAALAESADINDLACTPEEWFAVDSSGVITKFNPSERDDAPSDIVIPATIGGIPVTGIGAWAFQEADITSVVIPEGVTAIDHVAFTFCSFLQSVVIPEGVKTIGSDAFSFCGALEAVKLPASVTDIEAGAFQYCAAVESLVIPAGVTTIGGSAFIYCESLVNVTFLGQPGAIGGDDKNAFEGVGERVSCTLTLPAAWAGDPAVGTKIPWQGGNFTVVKAAPENPALAKVKEDAAAAIIALADDAPSEAIRAIVDKALGDIANAESIEAVNAIREQALADIAAQQEAEKPAPKSLLEQLLEMLDQYLPTVSKITRNLINATVKAMKDTAKLIEYLSNLFGWSL